MTYCAHFSFTDLKHSIRYYNDLPRIERGSIWWYKAIALHHTGKQDEARKLFDILSNQLSQVENPKSEWLADRKQAATLLGLDSTAEVINQSGN